MRILWSWSGPLTPRRCRAVVFRATLTLASAVLFAACASPKPTATGAATATATPTPPLPTPTLPALAPAGKGWVSTGIVAGQQMVFAPSTRSVAYVCGVQDSQRGPGPVVIAVTTNAGSSWDQQTSPLRGQMCALSINPTNPQDIALMATACAGSSDTCQSTAPTLARSRDGGVTWSPATPPSGTQFDDQTLMAWVGTTLFIAAQPIAMSLGGAPFTTVGQSFFGASSQYTYRTVQLFGLGSHLYVELIRCDTTTNPQQCAPTYAVADGSGTGWTFTPLTYHALPITIEAASPDGTVLIGSQTPQQTTGGFSRPVLVRSSDGGTTWSALPDYAAQLICCTPPADFGVPTAHPSVFLTPSGIILAELMVPGGGGSGGVFLLDPTTASWLYAGTLPPGAMLGVATGITGKPMALYGSGPTGLEMRSL